MQFLQPAALAAGVILPVIILLYLLRRRARTRPVSSVMLWERLEQSAAVDLRPRRLLKNLLLYLQLLTAALMVLALARPALTGYAVGGGGQNSVVIVDCSASMAVREQNGTRLEQAREYLRELIRNKEAADAIGVVGFAEEAFVISGIGTGGRALQEAVAQIEVCGGEANLLDALILAENMAASLEEPRLVLVSDGCLADPGCRPRYPLEYVAVGGETVKNLWLRNMVAGGSQLYLTVGNNGTVPAGAEVEVTGDAGTPLGRRAVSLQPGEQTTLVWRTLPAAAWYRGELRGGDQLSLDDVCFAVPAAAGGRRLLLVSEGNLFLERALMLQPGLEIIKTSPENYRAAAAGDFDYFVFDGFLPAELPAAPILVFDPPYPSKHLELLPPLKPGRLFTAPHRLTEHLDLSEVMISYARPLGEGRPLISCAGGTLAALLERQGRPLVVCGFALQGGDLPLRPAFPVFIRNIVDYFTGFTVPGENFSFGRRPLLDPPYQVEELTLVSPSGERHTLRAPFPRLGEPLRETGIYTVIAGDSEQLVPVNPPFAGEKLAAGMEALLGGEAVAGAAGARGGLPLFAPLVLLALLAASLEWWVDQRGY